MISKILLIITICSVPLILLIVMPQTDTDCSGDATCLKGKITDIIEGNVMVVNDTRVTLSLVSNFELDVIERSDSIEYLNKICPIGSDILVDEDDKQIDESHTRLIGKVFCQGKMLNEEILKKGFGVVDTFQCSQSEFGKESWAINFGC